MCRTAVVAVRTASKRQIGAIIRDVAALNRHLSPLHKKNLANSFGQLKETCFNKLSKWIESADNVVKLVEEGVTRILASPVLSAVQEDMLVNLLCAGARA